MAASVGLAIACLVPASADDSSTFTERSANSGHAVRGASTLTLSRALPRDEPARAPRIDRAAAREWIGSARGAAPRALSPRRLDLVRAAGALTPSATPIEVAGVRHSSFDLRKLGMPVFNRRVKRHEGALSRASGRLSLPPLDSEEWSGLSREAATASAARAVGLRTLRASPHAERGWFALEDRTAAAWRVTLPAREPFGTWQVIVGARGEIFASVDRMLHAQGSGSVYVPNVVESGGAVSQVPLPDLDDSGFLAGRIARVTDARAVEAFRPDLQFHFPTADPRFVQTSVYSALTETARLAESQGFPPFEKPLHSFVNLPGDGAGGEYNNAFYDPFLGFLGFGNGDGVVLDNVGTDSDVAAHELGHHLFETLAQPLAFFSSDPALAMHEGVADATAALWNGDPEIGESVRPGQPYLRTLAELRIAPDDVAADPHETGLIFGGLIWSLAQDIGADAVGRILMAGLPFLPPQPEPWEFPEALAAGDQVLNGGANAGAIEGEALVRGLDDPFPAEFRGEILEGAPESGVLADGAFEFWVFYEFPGCPAVTFRTTGTGDVDLLAGPVALLDDPSAFLSSAGATSTEVVTFTASTFPSVHADDIYLISVEDYPDGLPSTYTLEVQSTLPPAQIPIPGTRSDSLASADELDMFIVNGVAGQVMRVAVHSASPDLDLVAAVFDPRGSDDALGANDDAGPGNDPLIQGARFPATRPYAVAVFSLLGDVNPGAGTGSYTLDLSLCNNTGPNTDGDLLANACDDDDDGDSFEDDVDAAPTNAALCTDIDADGCDDCSRGSFDPFDDGPDFDGDAVCDAGDIDRDDDGCPNSADSAPLAPSIDPDLDFLGADCDNCPSFKNTDQLDTDGDRRGNACECGDQDGDGRNSVTDLVAINLAIFTPALATPLCDANGDQRCNVADIVATNLEIFSPGNTSICARQPIPGP